MALEYQLGSRVQNQQGVSSLISFFEGHPYLPPLSSIFSLPLSCQAPPFLKYFQTRYQKSTPSSKFSCNSPLVPSSLQIMQLDFVCRSTFLWLMIKMTLRRLPAISLKKAPKLWKMLFISPKMLFWFLKYADLCNFLLIQPFIN